MTEYDAIQLVERIVESAALTGFVLGYVFWYLARADE